VSAGSGLGNERETTRLVGSGIGAGGAGVGGGDGVLESDRELEPADTDDDERVLMLAASASVGAVSMPGMISTRSDASSWTSGNVFLRSSAMSVPEYSIR